MEEIWKTIKGFEGYMISDKGNVKSFKRSAEGSTMVQSKRGEYLSVALCKDGSVKRVNVHRLVADHFIDNDESLQFVNHKNGIKTDNRADNLEWCTPRQNTAHFYSVLKKGELLRDKPVIQYSKYGKRIRDWDSAIEASEGTGICIEDIIHSCNRRKKRETAKGFLWRFRGDEYGGLNYRNIRGVVHINKYGEKVGEYPSIVAASEAAGIKPLCIQKVCSGAQWHTEDGSIWRYIEDYNEQEFGRYINRTFIKMNPNGIFVERFHGTKELVDKTSVSLCSIIQHINGHQSSAGGYKWCIEEDGDLSRREKRRKAVCCFDRDMKFIREYKTISEAAAEMQCQPIHISIACRNENRTCRGLLWRYKNETV